MNSYSNWQPQAAETYQAKIEKIKAVLNNTKACAWQYSTWDFYYQESVNILNDLAESVEICQKNQDPRYDVAKELLKQAVCLVDVRLRNKSNLENVYVVKEFFNLKKSEYGENAWPATVEAIKAVNNFLKTPPYESAPIKPLLNSLSVLQNEMQGPYLYRKQNTALRKFVGALAVLTGLALIAAGMLLSPIITLPGTIGVAVLGGILIGRGLSYLSIKGKEITPESEKNVVDFASSVKALTKIKTTSAFFGNSNKKDDGEQFGTGADNDFSNSM